MQYPECWMNKLIRHATLTIRESFANFSFLCILAWRGTSAKGYQWKIYFRCSGSSQYMRGMYCHRYHRHCMAREEAINKELQEMGFASLIGKAKTYHNAQSCSNLACLLQLISLRSLLISVGKWRRSGCGGEEIWVRGSGGEQREGELWLGYYRGPALTGFAYSRVGAC